ncbi:glucose-6-phosphate isomerase [Noviherbaspirillum sedimenti]|uniref:Glucose-6-phosphate isomerase n=1 Tax=Noviherbaspirillum sedimenti TaxID=2320865 RepID=A0A3A3G270_9BURK|nr:glucose-6-phosphate isomerase [Noviherbaspirillum sedimenti]RJG02031.1 glucose-6-phosphate isomerase [Noviherbaspirillum sedimenti]
MDTEKNVAWQSVAKLAEYYAKAFDLRSAFNKTPQRFEELSISAPHVRADLSKNLWDREVLAKLLNLAEHAGLNERRTALLAGDIVNPTEKRPALHAWLRTRFSGIATNTAQESDERLQGLQDMLVLAESIRANPAIENIVHIGIGGSGLGPEMAVQALQPHHSCGQRLHFVGNLDGHDLHQTLQGLTPERTLFVVASKSWSTVETLRNARSAWDWFHAQGGVNAGPHFVAVTAKPELATAMGMGRILHMPEGVGGRYSLWSAIGLPLAVAIGAGGFAELLRGAAAMDAHFTDAPLQANLPVWLGLLDVWNSSFLQLASRCLVPYHHGLRRLPAYLQQLEMESNGKRVHANGTALDYPTTAALWGEVGSNSQHAFFQWLHQGTQRISTEFVLVRRPAHCLEGHHDTLLANGLAQAQALMAGAEAGVGQLPGHQDFPGNRPSTVLLLDELSPTALGALLALYEHRVFVAGVVWGINSFDQWGVELGKTLAKNLQQRLATGNTSGLDGSTAGLLHWICETQC